MLSANVVNTEKKDNIEGSTFNLFYPDLSTSILFDNDLTKPIIFGSKNVVMTTLKKIDELMNVKPETKIKVYSYLKGTNGYRRFDTFHSSISVIGKYIKHL